VGRAPSTKPQHRVSTPIFPVHTSPPNSTCTPPPPDAPTASGTVGVTSLYAASAGRFVACRIFTACGLTPSVPAERADVAAASRPPAALLPASSAWYNLSTFEGAET